MRKKLSFIILALIITGLAGCEIQPPVTPGGTQETGQTQQPLAQRTDDWQYNRISAEDQYGRGGGQFTGGISKMAMPTSAPMMAMEAAPANLGYAVGGAKDINNFRDNIKNGFLPIPTDITYEGLFYGYFFDTGAKEQCSKLFCPSYSTAISKDPLSEKPEYWLSVGLNSGIKESDFARKKLNLVVVMDISGSMSSPFNEYYYDRFGNRMEPDKEESGKTKMEISSKSIAGMLDKLNDDDRFGLVLFDDSAFLAKPLRKVGETDMKKLKDHILDLEAMNGTYMEAGMEMGTDEFKEYVNADPEQYENRIIFITDAMPNIGETSKEGLLGMLEDNADDGIYTTFVGVGVDFNTELIEALTKIRGANYFSIHSEKEFKKTFVEDFDYMVTPLVFDLKLELDAEGWEIEKVYGSPEADEATGEIMYVNTLFPSKTEEGETKGGIVLLKLNKTGEDAGKISLKVSNEDRNGKKDSDVKEIMFTGEPGVIGSAIGELAGIEDFHANTGIRKAILLTRYANLMKDWLIDEFRYNDKPDVPCPPIIVYETGIRCPEMRCFPPMPPPCEIRLGEWERQSVKLHVSRDYKEVFEDFAKYFEEEMKAIGDDTLEQELDVLKDLT
jgi:Ca-activated chloride channel homolog